MTSQADRNVLFPLVLFLIAHAFESFDLQLSSLVEDFTYLDISDRKHKYDCTFRN